MATRRRLDKAIRDEIERLTILEKLGPSEIYRRLQKDKPFKRSELPTLRTVQRMVRDFEDPSKPWSLAQVEAEVRSPDDVEFLMQMLHDSINLSYGRKAYLTQEEVNWALRIHWACPSMPFRDIRVISRHYMAGTFTHEDLDAYVGFRASGIPNMAQRLNELRGKITLDVDDEEVEWLAFEPKEHWDKILDIHERLFESGPFSSLSHTLRSQIDWIREEATAILKLMREQR